MSRTVAVRGRVTGVATAFLVSLAAGTVAFGGAPPASRPRAADPGAPWIVYSSDWSGPSQLYAVAPASPGARRQLTTAREPADCRYAPTACGYTDPVASPDGRRVLYRTVGFRFAPDGRRGGAALWLARTNGSARHRLPGLVDTYFGDVVLRSLASWTRDGARVAYSDRTATFVVDVRTLRVRTLPVAAEFVAWAPDGRALALRTRTDLLVWDGSRTRRVASGPIGGTAGLRDEGGRVAWSRDGRWLAFRTRTTSDTAAVVAVVGRNGGRSRVVGVGGWPAWSPTVTRLAFAGPSGLWIFDPSSGVTRRVARVSGAELAWSPEGTTVALAPPNGVVAVRVGDGRARLLARGAARSLAWAPRGRTLAYLAPSSTSRWIADLRTVDASGRVRTVVAAAGPYGGRVASFGWLASGRVRAPLARPATGFYAGGPVGALAAAGRSVAYVSCGRVYLADAGRAPVRVDARPPATDCVAGTDRANVPQILALGGGRLLYQVSTLSLSYHWELVLVTPGSPATPVPIDGGSASLGGAGNAAAGAAGLLVYSTHPACFGSTCPSVDGGPAQELRRVLSDGSAGVIAREPIASTSDAPLTPVDVDGDRIVTRGVTTAGRWLSIRRADGSLLLRLGVDAPAAGLSGDDLVVQTADGTIRVFDAATGTVRRELGSVGRLEDVAAGLAAVVNDDAVHVVRLRDGARTRVAVGTVARFGADGLVYADGSRIHAVPYAQLGG
ncbi:MAG: TolB family protein [Pseudomonadota bacterium]